jgi:hypothetical protein
MAVRAAVQTSLSPEDRWSPNDAEVENYAMVGQVIAAEDVHRACDDRVAETVDNTDNDVAGSARFDNIVHRNTSSSMALRSTNSLGKPQAEDSGPHSTRAARSQ